MIWRNNRTRSIFLILSKNDSMFVTSASLSQYFATILNSTNNLFPKWKGNVKIDQIKIESNSFENCGVAVIFSLIFLMICYDFNLWTNCWWQNLPRKNGMLNRINEFFKWIQINFESFNRLTQHNCFHFIIWLIK